MAEEKSLTGTDMQTCLRHADTQTHRHDTPGRPIFTGSASVVLGAARGLFVGSGFVSKLRPMMQT